MGPVNGFVKRARCEICKMVFDVNAPERESKDENGLPKKSGKYFLTCTVPDCLFVGVYIKKSFKNPYRYPGKGICYYICENCGMTLLWLFILSN